MAKDPYTDDEYDDTYKEVHGDEPPKDQFTNQATDDTFFPSGVGGALSPSGWGLWPSKTAADTEYGDHEDRSGPEASGVSRRDESDDGWLTEGAITMLLVIGVALFLFPEPATSAVGIGLIAVGVIGWLVDWLA